MVTSGSMPTISSSSANTGMATAGSVVVAASVVLVDAGAREVVLVSADPEEQAEAMRATAARRIGSRE